MHKIGLISCVKTKLDKPAKAKDLYISDLFKKQYLYSIRNYDLTFVLSAKHGLLELDEVIKPYELTLNSFTEKEKKIWAYRVIKQLKAKTDIKNDVYYIHAGINYRKYIIQKLKNYHIPLKGLSFGEQLRFYKNVLS
jgi:hypothetical protein